MRYFIGLAYKGTDFHGWQVQPNAVTVQERVNKGLSMLLKEEICVLGAGRTDVGVHAKQMYAHFDTDQILDCEKIQYRLNSYLCDAIHIKSIFHVSDTAHARFDAISRTYKYKISFCKDPFRHERYFELRTEINFKNIKTASEILLSHNDFKSFSKTRSDVKNYLCEISKAEWELKNNRAVFTITANRFLRNMVRAIVGTLIEVGKNKISVDDFNSIIIQRDRKKAGFSVPACGLYLVNVEYSKHIFL